MKRNANTTATIATVEIDNTAWTLTPTSVALMGHELAAPKYGVAKDGDVYVYTSVEGSALRLHFGKRSPMYHVAFECAMAAKAEPAAKPAEIKPAPVAQEAKPAPAKAAETKPATSAGKHARAAETKPVTSAGKHAKTGPAKVVRRSAEDPAHGKHAKPAPVAQEAKPAPAKPAAKLAPVAQEAKPAPAKPAEIKPAPVAQEAKPAPAKKPAKAAKAAKAEPAAAFEGKGWRIVYDEAAQRTRVIADDPTPEQLQAIEIAGFWWSNTTKSWNKKLTQKAQRAAKALALALTALDA